MSAWIEANAAWLWWTAAFSALGFVVTLAIVPLLIVRMPADYFIESRRHVSQWRHHHPLLAVTLGIVRNIVGLLLVMVGIAMLVLPGQGLLTIVLGLMLMTFPGKFAAERWLVTRPGVLGVINRMRHAAGREALRVECSGNDR